MDSLNIIIIVLIYTEILSCIKI